MGHNRYVPKSNSFALRNEQHKVSSTAIHRAIVTEVYIADGTCKVRLEDLFYEATINFPLLSLSVPAPGGTVDYKSASWGRYIPQKNDILLVAFESNGTLHALGYSSLYFRGLETADKSLEDSGGISWSKVSAKDIRQGDWDFKSSRGSVLYLGQKAKIGSSNCSTTYNVSTADIVTTTDLLIDNIGMSSFRYGSVRRRVLPTDAQEAYIPSGRLSPAGGISTAQEATLAVKWTGPNPDGSDLATLSFGDVVEEKGGTQILKLSQSGLPVRRYFFNTDLNGLVKTYEEEVDCLGNYAVTAATSTQFNWSTPLANWTITNLQLNVTSSASIGFTAPNISTTGFTLLGGPGALPLVKETPALLAAWTAYFTAAAAAFSALAAFPVTAPIAASLTPAATAAGIMAGQLSASATTSVTGL